MKKPLLPSWLSGSATFIPRNWGIAAWNNGNSVTAEGLTCSQFLYGMFFIYCTNLEVFLFGSPMRFFLLSFKVGSWVASLPSFQFQSVRLAGLAG